MNDPGSGLYDEFDDGRLGYSVDSEGIWLSFGRLFKTNTMARPSVGMLIAVTATDSEPLKIAQTATAKQAKTEKNPYA